MEDAQPGPQETWLITAGLLTREGDLRDARMSCKEGGVRIPFQAHRDRRNHRGAICDNLPGKQGQGAMSTWTGNAFPTVALQDVGLDRPTTAHQTGDWSWDMKASFLTRSRYFLSPDTGPGTVSLLSKEIQALEALSVCSSVLSSACGICASWKISLYISKPQRFG